MEVDSQSKYVEFILEIFDPILVAIEDPDHARQLLVELGYVPPTDVTAFNGFATAAGQLSDSVNSLNDAIQNGDNEAALTALLGLLATAGELFQALNGLSSAIQSNFSGTGLLADTDILAAIVRKTVDYVVVRFLEDNFKAIYAGLLLLGIIDVTEISAAPTAFHAPYLKRTVNWDQLTSLLSDPLTGLKGSLLKSDGLQYRRLVYFLYIFGVGIDRYSYFTRPDAKILSNFNNGNDLTALVPPDQVGPVDDGGDLVPLSSINPFSALHIPLLSDPAGGLELVLYPVVDPATGQATGAGVGLSLGGQLQIPLSEAFQLQLAFSSNLSDSLGVRLDTNGSFTFINKVFTANPETLAESIEFNVKVSVVPTATGPQGPLFTLEVPQGSELQIGSGALALGFQKSDTFTMSLEGDLKNVQLTFATGEVDSFLSSMMPQGGTKTAFDCGIGFSNQRGLYFTGASNFKVNIPLHLTLGPIEIEYLQIELGFNNNALPLILTTGFSAVLGPLSVAVDDIGVKATFTTVADRSGNFGPLDVGFGFKFPDGLGFSIDAGAVAGGGFVLFAEEKGEYAGFLDISIAEIIQVKFIAILDTKLPDGSKGYSLLFIIFMEVPPIQLGFGFTLNGVGGVAGVNRTMSPDGLQAGVHNHTLDYVINPPRTIAEAPKVINAVSSFFPPAQGRYLFGPILEVGWETFVLLTVGVILEVPDPIKLAILGIFDIALPTIEEPDVALVKIHIDVLGIIDFGAKKLSVDGSMYDSSLLEFPLLGDFALRSSWGPTQSSLFSFGGFNPHFNTDGLNVPQLHRLSIVISDGDNPVISANAYLALTSNTIQFGANVEATAHAGSFAVHGYLGFDLLVIVQRPTISFEFDFAASFDVSYKGHSLAGINVTGQLTGTTPWHLHGDASFHILCFSVSKSVDLTWGDTIAPAIPAVAVLPDLLPPFADPQNWNAVLPDGTTQAATLSTPKADNKAIIVHPMGILMVREKVVPLDLTIAQYKNGTPSDGTYFSIGDVVINGTSVSKTPYQDYFAAGQFLNLSDADKLSRSSFEPFDAGAQISSANTCAGAESVRDVSYNEFYIYDCVSPVRPPMRYVMPAGVFQALSHQSAGFLSPLKNTGLGKYKFGPSTPAATLNEPSYVVASTDDLSVRSDIVAAKGTTYYQAREALNSHLAKNPQDSGNLQILPTHEVAP